MESASAERSDQAKPEQVSRRPRVKRCGNTAHTDVIVRAYRPRATGETIESIGEPQPEAGVTRVRCTTCGDVFPCRDADCGHLDCGWVRSGECQLSEFSRAPGLASHLQVEAEAGEISEAAHATD